MFGVELLVSFKEIWVLVWVLWAEGTRVQLFTAVMCQLCVLSLTSLLFDEFPPFGSPFPADAPGMSWLFSGSIFLHNVPNKASKSSTELQELFSEQFPNFQATLLQRTGGGRRHTQLVISPTLFFYSASIFWAPHQISSLLPTSIQLSVLCSNPAPRNKTCAAFTGCRKLNDVSAF